MMFNFPMFPPPVFGRYPSYNKYIRINGEKNKPNSNVHKNMHEWPNNASASGKKGTNNIGKDGNVCNSNGNDQKCIDNLDRNDHKRINNLDENDQKCSQNLNRDVKHNSSEISDYNSQVFNIMGITLHFDDLLILCLLFFLYSEGIKDDMLFVTLILLLLD